VTLTTIDKERIDAQIIAAIKEGMTQFYRICNACDMRYDERAVDRRLQSLRKRGLISFDSKAGWSVT